MEAKGETMVQAGIATTGYEGKSIGIFLRQLVENGIQTVIDVRKNAHSRKAGFSKTKLKESLKNLGIEYIHMPVLGIPPELRRNLKTPSDYDTLFSEYRKALERKSESLSRIEEIGRERKVVLLCFERDARRCHRGVIAKELERGGLEVAEL